LNCYENDNYQKKKYLNEFIQAQKCVLLNKLYLSFPSYNKSSTMNFFLYNVTIKSDYASGPKVSNVLKVLYSFSMALVDVYTT